jgi:crotonobetainyl-CoA:carnitine CoA-transferase CaiB-like acyl-CoA transferase
MLESTLGSMGWVVSNYLNAGQLPVPMGNENFTAAPSGAFRTKDGLLNIAANENSQYHKLCDLLGRPDLKKDSRFEDREERRRNRRSINEEIAPELMKRSAAEWERLLIEEGVPAGVVLTVPEILRHEHLEQRRFIARFPNSQQKQTMTRGGFRFEGAETVPATPAPALSEHTDRWLDKLGYTADRIAELRTKGII